MFGASEVKKEGSTKNNKFSFSATIGGRSRRTKTLEMKCCIQRPFGQMLRHQRKETALMINEE